MRAIAHSALVVVVMLAVAFADGNGNSLSGFVRDTDGKAVAGAKVTLTNDETPPASIQTISGASGEYRFNALRAGRYQLTATMSGISAGKPANVVVDASVQAQKIDLIMTQAGTAAAAQPAGSRPPLKFEAAGVRGLIDPGGYSAPASAAAASGLVRGVADINRTGNNPALAAGNWPCGLEPELSKAVTAAPDNADANRRMGEFYLAHSQLAKAVPFLERAHQLKPQDSAIGHDLARAWLGSGQFDQALDLLNVLVKQESTAEVHRLLAHALEGSGKFTEASREYEVAAKLEPSEENLFGIGYELILAGLPHDAARAFESGVQQYPRSVTLLVGAGTAEFLEGRSSDAVHSFLQAADVNSADPRPYPFLAGTFSISGSEIEKVRAAFKRYLELAPDSADASYFYALSLVYGYGSPKQSDPADLSRAETLLKRALALDPKLAKAHFELGNLYAQRGDSKSAVPEYEETIRLAPDFKDAHYRLAAAYRQTGNNELATREIKLFEDMRTREGLKKDDTQTSIEQFLSVIDRPGQAPNASTQCPIASQ